MHYLMAHCKGSYGFLEIDHGSFEEMQAKANVIKQIGVSNAIFGLTDPVDCIAIWDSDDETGAHDVIVYEERV